MKKAIEFLQKSINEAKKNNNFTLANELEFILKLQIKEQELKQQLETERRERERTENMTPWEKQRYYDSWSGGFS